MYKKNKESKEKPPEGGLELKTGGVEQSGQEPLEESCKTG
jgi:hypothetical protein